MNVSVVSEAFVDVIVPTSDVCFGHTYHRRIQLAPGGLSNVASNIAQKGVNVSYIGRIGCDPFGSFFKAGLLRSAVLDHTVIDQIHGTGLCVSMYSLGERILVADRGANDYLDVNQISTSIDTLVSSDIVYFSGYSLASDISSAGIMFAMEECSIRETPIYFNPGAPNLINTKMLNVISKYVDVLIMNIAEAKEIAKEQVLESIVDNIKDLAEIIVVTLGERGCIVIDNGCFYQVDQSNAVESPSLESCAGLSPGNNAPMDLDTTGAGDVFSAGFIVGKLQRMTSIAAANNANWLAADYLYKKNERCL